MKKSLLSIILFATSLATTQAINSNTVEIVYSGTTATVTIAGNIKNYVTVESGTSSHVVITQAENFAGVDATVSNSDGEITYVLSGTSADGEFLLNGSFKCTVELNGVNLTNPNGPAINIQNGKRIAVSAKKGTTSTLADGANETYNGCYHCKGHTKFKGKGTLNVTGNSRHAIYSKEYIEVKNCTLNITAAQKDGIHCKEYFLMESGTVNIASAGDDGIQVELSSDPATGITTDHEDENTGNFYMADGTLTIKGYQEKAIKAAGTITYSGGTRNFNTADTEINAGISTALMDSDSTASVYDLHGRKLPANAPCNGMYVVKRNGSVKKVMVK